MQITPSCMGRESVKSEKQSPLQDMPGKGAKWAIAVICLAFSEKRKKEDVIKSAVIRRLNRVRSNSIDVRW